MSATSEANLTLCTWAPDLREMKVTDMKAAPEAELSHTATRGREGAKWSSVRAEQSGLGSSRRHLTWAMSDMRELGVITSPLHHTSK